MRLEALVEDAEWRKDDTLAYPFTLPRLKETCRKVSPGSSRSLSNSLEHAARCPYIGYFFISAIPFGAIRTSQEQRFSFFCPAW